MAITPRSFLYTLDHATGVAMITLNRPERLNALTFEVYAELRDTFRALDTERGRARHRADRGGTRVLLGR